MSRFVRRLVFAPADPTDHGWRGGVGVLLAVGVLRAAGTDARGVLGVVTTLAPLGWWLVGAVAVDVLAATADRRTYFELEGRFPVSFRLLLPLIFYGGFLFAGGDEEFRELLVRTAWGTAPLVVPAGLAAAGVGGVGLAAAWAGALAWTALLWWRALSASRGVSRRFAAVAVGGVALVAGWLAAPEAWRP